MLQGASGTPLELSSTGTTVSTYIAMSMAAKVPVELASSMGLRWLIRHRLFGR
jgi:hypothetical protein